MSLSNFVGLGHQLRGREAFLSASSAAVVDMQRKTGKQWIKMTAMIVVGSVGLLGVLECVSCLFATLLVGSPCDKGVGTGTNSPFQPISTALG